MKQIITALCNKKVNDKLNEYKEIKVIMKDIQYQEGILEAIEINSNIEFVILSELLPGPYNIKELINKIIKIKKEIKIIIILEKENIELEKFLLLKNNIKIFYNNEIKIKELVEIIKNEKKENIEKEIQELKNNILKIQTKKKKIKNKYNNKTKKYTREKINKEKNKLNQEYIPNKKLELKNKIKINNKYKKGGDIKNKINKSKKKNKSKIILISGINGVGKSFFAINIAKALAKQKNKILIIEFDFENYSIKTLLGIKNKQKFSKNYYTNKIEDIIIDINKNIKLISNINKIFLENKIQEIKIQKIIKEQKIKYDYIIIDINSLNNKMYLKSIINDCDKIIFLSEPNIIQIKKSQKQIDKIIKEWKIQKEKIYILFNKNRKDSIDLNILKLVFKNYNIIGKIDFVKNNNTLVNQKMKSIFLKNKIKKQYQKVAKEISKNEKIKNYYLDRIIN